MIPSRDSLTSAPVIVLPIEIDAAGAASNTFPAGTLRAFTAAPHTSAAQLRTTIDGVNYDFPAGAAWEQASPTGIKFGNQIILTALVGKFTISKTK